MKDLIEALMQTNGWTRLDALFYVINRTEMYAPEFAYLQAQIDIEVG